eukprot:gb/GEZN01017967.1/.p1 GENE.gb/GEZN01017967.1/~~gb/GEZN01017967.1/.p1  ORF type:complete len:217 (-),score=25.41 gb/GEZN01017967.1/:97-747(-)
MRDSEPDHEESEEYEYEYVDDEEYNENGSPPPGEEDPRQAFLRANNANIQFDLHSNYVDPEAVLNFVPHLPKDYNPSLGNISVMDNCIFKCLFSGVAGYGMGLFMGVVMGSFGENPVVQDPSLANKSTREQLKIMMKDTKIKSLSMAKNFGQVGMLYSMCECLIERQRASHDILNPIMAGCAAGGVLGARGGPQATALGCAGFAAFSTAIELYLRS